MSKRRAAVAFAIGLFIAGNVSGQDLVPSSPAPEPAGATAEVERVIVTGSNIPTAEETGPNPVDTYRREDIQKLGVHNATDLLTKLPQEMGSTVNQNIANGGDGSVIPNLRGLLPKETLVLIDGKRAAIIGGGGGAGPGTAGVDINLIPFPMIDHIDILKDGASALYGSDAVAGVINIFLSHNSPPPHSAPNKETSPYYINRPAVQFGYPDGDYIAYNFAALTPSIPAANRQSFYGSVTRDICDKYLTVFADFKYTRSF